jgi:hypothetical protein
VQTPDRGPGQALYHPPDPQFTGFRVMEGPQADHARPDGDLPAETAEAGAAELDSFETQWGKRYPAIGQAWRRAWE